MNNASCDLDEPLTVSANGTCEFPDNDPGNDSKCPLNCGDAFFPVCGNDDITYPNACLLKKKRCEDAPRLRVGF